MQDQVSHNSQTIHLKGTGDFKQCQASLVPLLNLSSPCAKQPCSFNGVFQPEIEFRNSEFYGFSEYWYCMEDVLRIGGMYNYVKFELAAKVNIILVFTKHTDPCHLIGGTCITCHCLFWQV